MTVPFAAHPFAAHAQPERWLPPVPPPLVVGRKFDPPPKHWQAGHRGVDLCVAVGTPVRAPRAGTVVYAGKLVDRQVVSIAHEGGLRSTFEPLSPTVSVGQTIPAGTVVGTLEPGHEGDCLHWGVKRGRHEYLNPLLLVIGEVRLLPWED
ncbi:MAG: M23 family metallopeptidase [Actinomycetaceae bacterium]|nr:M23 family metallopeptidase [Actinomycetaceae bacterium]